LFGGLTSGCASPVSTDLNAVAPVASPAEIIKQSVDSDWRSPNPENLLYLQLETGLVIMEMAPEFAPGHVANTRALVREKYFDGLAFYRVAEGFVAQGGDPQDNVKSIRQAKRTIPAELYLDGPLKSPFTLVDLQDGFAAQTGYVSGFPVARNEKGTESWMTHCPGALAMARDNAPDSGGATIYIVIGHAPRYLDRNTTVFGRVLRGLEYVQQLRRGYEPAGIIKSPQDYNPIISMRVATDIPAEQRQNLQVMRTDSQAFREMIISRANRPEEWFYERPGYVDVCAVPVPLRRVK